MLLVILLYSLIALSFSLGKALLQLSNLYFITSARMLIAGCGMLLYGYKTVGSSFFRIVKSEYVPLFIVSWVHMFIPFFFEYKALSHMSPSVSCLFYNMSPFITALISYCLYSERLSFLKWMSLISAFLAMFNFSLYVLQNEIVSLPFVSFFYMIIAVISSCAGWIFVQHLIAQKNMSILRINGISMFFSGVYASIGYFFIEYPATVACNNGFKFIFLLLLLILLANIIFYTLYSYLLTKYSATFLSFVGFLTPFLASLFEYILFEDAIFTHEMYGSMIFISFCLYFFYREEIFSIQKRVH